MKADELMIGDWVMHCNTPKNVAVIWGESTVSLDDPNKDLGSIYTDEFPIDDITPIPLTPEILEKNGFNQQGIAGWLFSEPFGRKQILVQATNNGYKLYIDCAESPTCHLSITIHYVHELQNALRVCRIEKDIEL